MTFNPYGVRRATQADADRLADFVVAYYEEEGTGQPISRPKVEAMVERCIQLDGGVAGIVDAPDGSIVASIGATVEEFAWTDQPHVEVKWLRVDPAHRFNGKPNLSKLMHFAEWLHDAYSQSTGSPMPVFVPALLTPAQRPKLLALDKQAQMVCGMYAYGVLPGQMFLGQHLQGTAGNGGWGSSTRSTHGRPSAPQRRSA